MRALLLATAAIALALSPAAHAAPTTAKAAPHAAKATSHAAKAAPGKTQTAEANGLNEQTITEGLKRAGFTDIKVAPVVFLARAKDKDGHSVLMAFRPPSLGATSDERSQPSNDEPNIANNAGQPQPGSGTADNLDTTDKVQH